MGSDAVANTSVPTTARGSYIWRSTSLSSELIQVHPLDAGACTPPCNYYIGIQGYRSNASYVVTASTGSAAPTRLIMGQPQNGAVAAGAWMRYTADFNASAVTITVAPVQGDPGACHARTHARMPAPATATATALILCAGPRCYVHALPSRLLLPSLPSPRPPNPPLQTSTCAWTAPW